ncbi:MAG TPA: cation:proton antiporter [Polyangiaceae bacterium]|nr:cation:proton antiporter [Polyangiaceae bacterium]
MSHPGLLDAPLPRLLLQIGLIVGSSRVLGRLTERLHQPRVLAEITAGILLGPSLFGWLWPNAYRFVFEPASLPALGAISQLGLILFMFLVGLELDPAMLRGNSGRSIAISHASIVAPFVLGVLLAFGLQAQLRPEGVPFMSFALFMGTAMSITAFPVLARILKEQRLLNTRVGNVTITCAAVDDVTAWCILAFVVASSRASGLGSALVTTLLAAGYIALMFLVVRRTLARLAIRISGREVLTQNVVAATLLVLLVSSFVTESIGIHALFGAFLFGAIVPKQGNYVRALADKLEDLVLVLLLPLFFAFSGLRTSLGLLQSPAAWLMCLAIVAVACIGKFGASTLAARISGLSWRESSALGALMNTRGLMELIVLNIGLDLGVIGPELFTMMVVMALVTTSLTTPLLHRLYPRSRLQETIAEPESAVPIVNDGFTALICVADSRVGPSLASLADALCPARDARVYALHLITPSERGSFADEAGPLADATLKPLLERARSSNLPIRSLGFTSIDPAADIANVAEVKEADLVLLGSHKPVLGQSLLGGSVYRVMRLARTDVGVLIDRGLKDVRRVLVPFMGTPHDLTALAIARRILSKPGSEVVILHVIERAPDQAEAAREPLGAREAVDSVFPEGRGSRVRFRVEAAPDPASAILKETRNDYDLVIIGLSRSYGLEERAFGVQRERLLDQCQTSLLVVRSKSAREPVSTPQAAPLL